MLAVWGPPLSASHITSRLTSHYVSDKVLSQVTKRWSITVAHLLGETWGVFGPLTGSICCPRTLGRSGPIVGPWAVRAQLLDPGPFGPICWTLGRSGPFVGPWAVRAHWLDPGPFGPIGWACPMPRLGMSHARLGMSHARLGMSHAQVCLLYTSPSPRDATLSRMPSSA